MKLNTSSTVIWAASIEDRPAGLAEKLEPLSRAGANLQFILARRAPETPGKGVVFVAPLKGVRQCRAAVNAGFVRANSLHAVRIEGADDPGLATRITSLLGHAAINLRGFSASVIGRRFVAYLAFDDVDDVKNAMKVLEELG